MMRPPHLVAVGDALADFVVDADASACRRLGVEPGTAAFRSRAAVDAAIAGLGPTAVAASAGGSVANTSVAFAASGGHASLLTPSMGDELAHVVRNDLAARGVRMPLGPFPGGATGRCLVLALPAGEHAFMIWQGEPWRLRVLRERMEASMAGATAFDGLLVEGYLLATAEGMDVARLALARSSAVGARRVLTLSHRRLVTEHRGRFDALLAEGVDIVIGNQAEVMAMTGAADVEQAAASLVRLGATALVTMGERGALAHGEDGSHFASARSRQVENSLGAGDAFAGGFLYGVLSGRSVPDSLTIGYNAAIQVLDVRHARAPVRSSARPRF